MRRNTGNFVCVEEFIKDPIMSPENFQVLAKYECTKSTEHTKQPNSEVLLIVLQSLV